MLLYYLSLNECKILQNRENPFKLKANAKFGDFIYPFDTEIIKIKSFLNFDIVSHLII